MVEYAKQFLIEFPVEAAMNVVQSSVELPLAGEGRQTSKFPLMQKTRGFGSSS
jgi:hypothetical protein